MKHFIHFLRCFLLLGFISSFLGCSTSNDEMNPNEMNPNEKKENNITDSKSISSTDIKGIWVNTLTSWDTLMIKDSIIFRWDELSNGYFHYYKYKINSDSIILDYSGNYKIGVPTCTRKILLNEKQDSLIIRDFHTVYPGYEGDIFLRQKNNK